MTPTGKHFPGPVDEPEEPLGQAEEAAATALEELEFGFPARGRAH
jgi:hypothetical protein